MSTRCQVTVMQEGMRGWEERVTLYHHFDGYPEGMLPLFKKAFEIGMTPKGDWHQPGCELGRVGKVASFLCAADPGGFEPEEGHALHGDIEFFYRLWCVNHRGGTVGDQPTWDVEVLIPAQGFFRKDAVTEDDLEVETARMPLDQAIAMLPKDELVPA